jgi:glycerophosphoryl diester phosphodiesterase
MVFFEEVSMTVPMVIGHRGWPTRFPDNTLAGFLAAAEVADAVELDIRRSKDGKLVLSHDPSIDGLVVSEQPWSVLGDLDLGGGHKPALLDEMIATIPDLPAQFEIKNLPHEPGFEPDHRVALEAAERARPGDMVTSFNWLSLAAVRGVFPDVPTGVLVGGSGDIEEAITVCLQGGHPALLPSVRLTPAAVEMGLAAGLSVFPWVVNDGELATRLAALGVSGMITDDPAVVRGVVGGGR